MQHGQPPHQRVTKGGKSTASRLTNGVAVVKKRTLSLQSKVNGSGKTNHSSFVNNSSDITTSSANNINKTSSSTHDRDELQSSSGHSSSSNEEDVNYAEKQCLKFQRQRSAIFQNQNSLYDYRLLMSSIHSRSARKRKLILHVDIRNTILVADSITNVSVEEALNSFLTAVVWGQDIDGEWQWYSDIPSLKAPAPCLMTYYKFLEKKLVRNEDDRAKLRLQTGDFVHTEGGKQFHKHFNVHLARLAWKYPQKSMDKVLTMSGKDGRPYHYILPSFYKLLQHLMLKRRDFAIILRTYGRDAENVLSSLHYGIQGNHPAFRLPLNLPVHKKPGIISRNQDEFILRTFKSKSSNETLQLLTFDRDIYRHFSSSKGISGFVDDFCSWQGKNYHHAWGKPFWIDPCDTRHHHIFFDDNFRSDDVDSIVDVRLFSKENPAIAESLSQDELHRFENVCLVQADLLESIADESYFIRMVRICEDNYNRMISDGVL